MTLRSRLESHYYQIQTWLQTRDEPRVTVCCDRAGNAYYQVYDPITGHSASFGSEAEIRWWLETRSSQ
jgi:hypothetical protein